MIKSGKHAFVIFSNPRLMEGHLLVISKRHVERISELNEEERKEMFNMVVDLQEKIIKNVALGCDIRQHYRPFQGESRLKVDHLHIHLQPRRFEDDVYRQCQIFEKDIFKPLTEEEVNRITKLLE